MPAHHFSSSQLSDENDVRSQVRLSQSRMDRNGEHTSPTPPPNGFNAIGEEEEDSFAIPNMTGREIPDVTLKKAVKQVRAELIRLFVILVVFLLLLIAGSFAIVGLTSPVFDQISDFHALVFSPEKLSESKSTIAKIIHSVNYALFSPHQMDGEETPKNTMQRVGGWMETFSIFLNHTVSNRHRFIQREQFQDRHFRQSVAIQQRRLDEEEVLKVARYCHATTPSLKGRMNHRQVSQLVEAFAAFYAPNHDGQITVDWEQMLRTVSDISFSNNRFWDAINAGLKAAVKVGSNYIQTQLEQSSEKEKTKKDDKPEGSEEMSMDEAISLIRVFMDAVISAGFESMKAAKQMDNPSLSASSSGSGSSSSSTKIGDLDLSRLTALTAMPSLRDFLLERKNREMMDMLVTQLLLFDYKALICGDVTLIEQAARVIDEEEEQDDDDDDDEHPQREKPNMIVTLERDHEDPTGRTLLFRQSDQYYRGIDDDTDIIFVNAEDGANIFIALADKHADSIPGFDTQLHILNLEQCDYSFLSLDQITPRLFRLDVSPLDLSLDEDDDDDAHDDSDDIRSPLVSCEITLSNLFGGSMDMDMSIQYHYRRVIHANTNHQNNNKQLGRNRVLGYIRDSSIWSAAEDFTHRLSSTGGCLSKTLQVLCIRKDLIKSPILRRAFRKAANANAPQSIDQVWEVIHGQDPLDFDADEFDRRFEIIRKKNGDPLGVGSVGQVEKLKDRDTGEKYVLKVAFERTRAAYNTQWGLLEQIAQMHLSPVLTEMFKFIQKQRQMLFRELDFRMEAQSTIEAKRLFDGNEQAMERIKQVIKSLPDYFHNEVEQDFLPAKVVPIEEEFLSQTILVQHWAEGTDLIDYMNDPMIPEQYKILCVRNLVLWLGYQLFEKGYLHSDLHAGNVKVEVESSVDQRPIALWFIDWGQTDDSFLKTPKSRKFMCNLKSLFRELNHLYGRKEIAILSNINALVKSAAYYLKHNQQGSQTFKVLAEMLDGFVERFFFEEQLLHLGQLMSDLGFKTAVEDKKGLGTLAVPLFAADYRLAEATDEDALAKYRDIQLTDIPLQGVFVLRSAAIILGLAAEIPAAKLNFVEMTRPFWENRDECPDEEDDDEGDDEEEEKN